MWLHLPNQHLLPIIGLLSLVDQLLTVEVLRPILLQQPVEFLPNKLEEPNTGYPMFHQGVLDSQQELTGIWRATIMFPKVMSEPVQTVFAKIDHISLGEVTNKRVRGSCGDRGIVFAANLKSVRMQSWWNILIWTYSSSALKPSSSAVFKASSQSSYIWRQLWRSNGMEADTKPACLANSKKLGERFSCLHWFKASWKCESFS